MFKIQQEIVDKLKSYIGQEEISGNRGFKEKGFERLMRKMGWKKFQSWCVYFVELVWKEVYSDYDSVIQELDKLFSASATQTWNNFKKNDNWFISIEPVVGAIAIWQRYKNGNPTWMGHAGIVVNIKDNYITTVDGNTNKIGGREGLVVRDVTRKMEFYKEDGLVLLGFIYPNKVHYNRMQPVYEGIK